MRAALLSFVQTRRQFIVYCVIGVMGVTLDFLIYSALIYLEDLHPQYANAIGYASGTVLSFFLNAVFNFKASDNLMLRFLSFSAVAFLGWAASVVVLYLLIDRAGMNVYLAKAATIFVIVAVQYNLNRIFSFRKVASTSNA